MQNVDQIRAVKALKVAGETSRQDVSRLPAMIIANGLLATAAFAAETTEKGKPKRPGMKVAMDSVAGHLSNPELGLLVMREAKEAADIIKRLTEAPAAAYDLQRATAEALHYIGYLKRFAQKAGDTSEQAEE